MATTPGITSGDWTFDPHDPGFGSNYYEPADPYVPANVYSLYKGLDGLEHVIPIATMEIPQYQEYDADAQRYEDEPQVVGDQDANARFMASAPSMWRALKAVRAAMLDSEGGPEWSGPWTGVFDAIDGAIKRAEGVEGYEEHDGRTRRGAA
jgi:hypothetical protein